MNKTGWIAAAIAFLVGTGFGFVAFNPMLDRSDDTSAGTAEDLAAGEEANDAESDVDAGSAAGGGGPASGSSECRWELGMSVDVSGPNATLSAGLVDAAEFAAARVSSSGDLACKLVVTTEDTQGQVAGAQQSATALVLRPRVVAALGPATVDEVMAAGSTFESAGVAFLTIARAPALADQGWQTFFRLIPNLDADAGATAAYIEMGLGAQTTAVVHDNQAGKPLADRVKEDLGDAAEGPFIINPEEQDFAAVVSQVEQVDPDVFYFGGEVGEGGPLLKQAREAGVDATFIASAGVKAPDFGGLAGAENAEGALVVCGCVDATNMPAGGNLVAGYQQQHGSPPGPFGREMIDAVLLVAEALKGVDAAATSGEVRAAVVDFLHSGTAYQGIVGRYAFAPDGELDAVIDRIWVYEWSNDAGDFISVGRVSDLVQ